MEDKALDQKDTMIVPAPWKLDGLGVIIVFWGPRRIDPYSGVEVAGIGSAMIVKYESSPVGAYNELLYIPGMQSLNGKKGFFISKIFVDSQASVVGGRSNWGIPKEYADISILKENPSQWNVQVGREDSHFFEARIKPLAVNFPITTALFPIALVQHLDGKNFKTKFKGKGSARFCKVNAITNNTAHFPDLSQFKILSCLAVEPFKLEFPVPEIY